MSGATYWKAALCCLPLLFGGSVLADGVLIFAISQSRAGQAAFDEALEGFRSIYSQPVTTVTQQGDFSRALSSPSLPSLIVAVGPQAAQFAARRAKNIPIFYILVREPALLGLSAPNITGIFLEVNPEVQLTFFKRLLPNLKTIGTLYSPARSAPVVASARALANRHNLRILAAPVESPNDVPLAFSLISPPLTDALWMFVVRDESFTDRKWFDFLIRETRENRLPFLTTDETFVKEGALCALIPDFHAIGRQCGELVGRIERREAKLADIPPRGSPGYPVINANTAKRIALEISPELLAPPTRIVQ